MVRRLSYILGTLALLACNRGGSKSSSSVIAIRVPAHLRAQVPAGQTACYAINITGADLTPTSGNACMPSSAVNTDFVQADQPIQATIPKNNITVQVDLYLYLEPSGSNTPCPSWNTALSSSQIANVFKIGSAPVSLTSDQNDVTIQANYTGTNIVVQNSLPTSCIGSGISPNHYTINSGYASATGSNINLNARVGSSHPIKKLSNAGYTLLVR